MEEGMSMEQFTLKKEAEMKARGAEIITRDGQASAADGSSGYRPKVATWGVFPRPQNISEAFGGGRNIRPGQVGFIRTCALPLHPPPPPPGNKTKNSSIKG
jgi:hypothetical protein